MTQTDKKQFWQVVERCLEVFHKQSHRDARAGVESLQQRIAAAPQGTSKLAIYHSEPFDIACDIAKHNVKLARLRDEYEAILKQHGATFEKRDVSLRKEA